MYWLNILALIALFLGVVNGFDRLKSMRSQEHPQAEIAWRQKPASTWRYEMLSMVAITIHSLGFIGLAAVILRYLIRSEAIRFPPVSTPRELFLLAVVAVFYTAYRSGLSIGFHLGMPLIRPVSYGISNAGLWYGGCLIRWKAYSHYAIGPDNGQISLYSSYSPRLRTWVLQPPPECLVGVLELIQKNLSRAAAIEEPIPWQRSPLALILGISALVLGASVPALWGLLQNLSWTWLYALAVFLLVDILGKGLMTVFDGRGKHSEGEAQTT